MTEANVEQRDIAERASPLGLDDVERVVFDPGRLRRPVTGRTAIGLPIGHVMPLEPDPVIGVHLRRAFDEELPHVRILGELVPIIVRESGNEAVHALVPPRKIDGGLVRNNGTTELRVVVEKDSVLFRIDPRPYQNTVDRLEAMLVDAGVAVSQLGENLQAAEASLKWEATSGRFTIGTNGFNLNTSS